MKSKADLKVVVNWTVAEDANPAWIRLWGLLLRPSTEETTHQAPAHGADTGRHSPHGKEGDEDGH